METKFCQQQVQKTDNERIEIMLWREGGNNKNGRENCLKLFLSRFLD